MDLAHLTRGEFGQLYLFETREGVTPLATLGSVILRTNPLLPPRVIYEELEQLVDSLRMQEKFKFANAYEPGEGLPLTGIQGFLKDYPIVLHQLPREVYKRAVSVADKSVGFDKERLRRDF